MYMVLPHFSVSQISNYLMIHNVAKKWKTTVLFLGLGENLLSLIYFPQPLLY